MQAVEEKNDSRMDEGLCPITVRFTKGALDAIRDIAAENGVSMAELVRMAVAGNLASYLGTVRILDKRQAKEVKDLIVSLMDMVSQIQTELNRIGVNYNQEIRLKNIERKYQGKLMGSDIMNMIAEKEKVENECQGFSKEDMDGLMSRYEAATKQVGDVLCRILM